ncbi:hypothetical protein H4Q26_007299 [Puccinia striiformis f. sp. tritici PST-130]|nr:hypothetical protein H4Q26_007299 [Puccinia striiformis f. sp. tritici PST-130]
MLLPQYQENYCPRSSKPLCEPHLDYYPVDSAGLNMHKMSQSWEWRCKLKAKCIKPETTSVPNDPNFKIIIPKYLRYDSPRSSQ